MDRGGKLIHGPANLVGSNYGGWGKKDMVSGTISVSFETDLAGTARRRTKVTKLDITGPDGGSETETVTETLERRLISRRG